jgi:hypothetical protein
MPTAQIGAALGKSASFGWTLSGRLGIETRSQNEGKELAAAARITTIRNPFSGAAVDKLYAQDFAEGDLDVRRVSSAAIMASSTTTHPAFSRCFRELFQENGPIYHYPSLDSQMGYRWKVATRLDNSFEFLLPSQRRAYPEVLSTPELFFA